MDCNFIPDALKSLTDYPSDITSERIRHLCTVLECNKLNQEAQKWGAPDTFDGQIKYLISNCSTVISPGVMQILVVGVCVACSEAIAETYGSVMENYHNDRFINAGTSNDDIRLQK